MKRGFLTDILSSNAKVKICKCYEFLIIFKMVWMGLFCGVGKSLDRLGAIVLPFYSSGTRDLKWQKVTLVE